MRICEINPEVRTALSAGIDDLPALEDPAAAPFRHQVLGSRQGYDPQIDLGTGYVVLIVVAGAERKVDRMMRMRKQPTRVIALDYRRVTVAHVAATQQIKRRARIQSELEASLQTSEIQPRLMSSCRRR